MADFTIKQNDDSPAFERTLSDSSGTVINLTGSTVRFHLYDQTKDTAKIDAAATITDAANGVVVYTWAAGDTDTVGWYWGEFEVTYSDTTVETFPNSGYISVKVTPELA